jgi:AcrR family transcriptional regulator
MDLPAAAALGYPAAAKALLRDTLLDAASDRAVAGDWGAVRMADVAAAAGVSRQTLYNEFGSKDGLAREVVLRLNSRFLRDITGVLEAQRGAPLARAVAAAVRYTLDRCADDPLLKAILTGSRHDDLLPFLTTRSEPLMVASRQAIGAFVTQAHPELDPHQVAVICDAAVRLTVSHVVLPLGPSERTATELGEIVARYLGAPAVTTPVPAPASTPENP